MKNMIAEFVKIEPEKKSGKKESAGEKKTRELLETRLGKKFISIRPDWLRGEKGANLEIDGWCEELNLGFEYNGLQHLKPGQFGMSPEQFSEQRGRDRLKYAIFLQRGVRCIILENTSVENIEEEIARQLKMIDEKLYNQFVSGEKPSLFHRVQNCIVGLFRRKK